MKTNVNKAEQDSLENPAGKKARAGWDAQFREMAPLGDDALLDFLTPLQAVWDEDEWEW